MKKLMLYLAGMLAMAMFATDASAIPAFARQVGMACSACHYQHFPELNSFGRAFKENGYTMIGAEEKIEAENLSLPAVLNLAIAGSVQYSKTNGTPGGTYSGGKLNTNDGQLDVPSGISLFSGGRVGEHIGYEAEIALNTGNSAGIANAGTSSTTQLFRFKMPFVFDLGSVKTMVIPFSTGLGPADSFEVLNTGAVAVHTFNQQDMPAISAQQYIGTGGAANPGSMNFDGSTGTAHGVAFVASNDDFFANFAKWGATLGDGSGAPTSNYLRGAWTTSLIPGFDSAIGFQSWSGTSEYSPSSGAILTNGPVETKAWAVDAQMLGDVKGMPLTLIASYANAAADAGGSGDNGNLYNPYNPTIGAGAFARKSFNMGAELGIIPNKATVQLGFRRANSGFDVGALTTGAPNGQNASDNAVYVGATYSMTLNTRLEFTYSRYSGDMYSAAAQAAENTAAPGSYLGDSLATATLWFGF